MPSKKNEISPEQNILSREKNEFPPEKNEFSRGQKDFSLEENDFAPEQNKFSHGQIEFPSGKIKLSPEENGKVPLENFRFLNLQISQMNAGFPIYILVICG